MNLAEYRRVVRDAYREYQEALQSAADSLQKKLAVAEAEFFGDKDESIKAEHTPARYREESY